MEAVSNKQNLELPLCFERSARTQSPQIGADGRVRVSDLLRMEQETGEEHMDTLKLGYENLQKDGIAILITTNAVTVNRMPVRNEKLRIVTKILGTAGVYLYRNFTYFCGEEQLVKIRQQSVCVDVSTHTPLRPGVMLKYGFMQGQHVPPEERIARLHVKTELPPVLGTKKVFYSDLDMNQHLNNTVYADIVMDFVPEKYRSLKSIQIQYISECRLGDELELHGEEKEDGTFLMFGENERGLSFAAKLGC